MAFSPLANETPVAADAPPPQASHGRRKSSLGKLLPFLTSPMSRSRPLPNPATAASHADPSPTGRDDEEHTPEPRRTVLSSTRLDAQHVRSRTRSDPALPTPASERNDPLAAATPSPSLLTRPAPPSRRHSRTRSGSLVSQSGSTLTWTLIDPFGGTQHDAGRAGDANEEEAQDDDDTEDDGTSEQPAESFPPATIPLRRAAQGVARIAPGFGDAGASEARRGSAAPSHKGSAIGSPRTGGQTGLPRAAQQTAPSAVVASATSAPRHPLRGYPWRPTEAHPFYVPPSHRNPTGLQAFFDTHFGTSSGWRSLSSLADPVRRPSQGQVREATMARKVDKWAETQRRLQAAGVDATSGASHNIGGGGSEGITGSSTTSGSGAKVNGSVSSGGGAGWLDASRWRGPFANWNFGAVMGAGANAGGGRPFWAGLGLLAPASGEETRLAPESATTASSARGDGAPTSSPHHPQPRPPAGRAAAAAAAAAASSAASSAWARAYEPQHIPTVRRDPDAPTYLANLRGEDVVLLGGYRGSVLRDAESGQMLWVPLKVGMGLRRPTLELGLRAEDEDRAEETVVPDGMLSSIGRIADMGKRLQQRLAKPAKAGGGAKVYSWGYDWRQSLERSSARLQAFLTRLWEESAARVEDRRGAHVVAHSMGGLVALHALATTRESRIFASLVCASTPFEGTPNILGPLRYGDSALRNDTICSPAATFSFRSSFYLLPVGHRPGGEDGDAEADAGAGEVGRCFEEEDGTPHDVDFLSPETWSQLRFSPRVRAGGWERRLAAKRQRRSPTADGEGSLGAAGRGGNEEKEVSRTDATGGLKPPRGHADDGRGEDAGRSRGPGKAPLEMQLSADDAGGGAERTALRGAAGAAQLGKALASIADRAGGGGEVASAAAGERTNESREQERKQHQRRSQHDGNDDEDEDDAEVEEEEEIVWDYLERVLGQVRRFHRDIREGFSEERLRAGHYPALAVLTSGHTPTVRGALAGGTSPERRRSQSDEGADHDEPAIAAAESHEGVNVGGEAGGKGCEEEWKRSVRLGDYSRMLYAPGDGIVLRESSASLPGRWGELLARGAETEGLTDERGCVETSHRHVTLLSDVDGVARALEACRRASEARRRQR